MNSARGRRAGFSLLEILLALTLVFFLLFFSFLGYTRLMEAAALSGGARLIEETLGEARQEAMTQNTPVEIRFYSVSPGPAYGSFQARWEKGDGTTPPAGQIVVLPSPAVIDATPAHSSLVTTNSQTPSPDSTDMRLDAQTRCFHFLPDGSTDLAPEGKWLLTLRTAAQSNPAHFPANWACISLDPMTGRTQLYRP